LRKGRHTVAESATLAANLSFNLRPLPCHTFLTFACLNRAVLATRTLLFPWGCFYMNNRALTGQSRSHAEGQQASSEFRSLLKEGRRYGSASKPASPERRKTPANQMIIAGLMVLACMGIIIGWFVKHFSAGANFSMQMQPQSQSQLITPSALSQCASPVALPASGYQGFARNTSALPPTGFHSQGSARAYGLQYLPTVSSQRHGKRKKTASVPPSVKTSYISAISHY
jgi:hypothetical protein